MVGALFTYVIILIQFDATDKVCMAPYLNRNNDINSSLIEEVFSSGLIDGSIGDIIDDIEETVFETEELRNISKNVLVEHSSFINLSSFTLNVSEDLNQSWWKKSLMENINFLKIISNNFEKIYIETVRDNDINSSGIEDEFSDYLIDGSIEDIIHNFTVEQTVTETEELSNMTTNVSLESYSIIYNETIKLKGKNSNGIEEVFSTDLINSSIGDLIDNIVEQTVTETEEFSNT